LPKVEKSIEVLFLIFLEEIPLKGELQRLLKHNLDKLLTLKTIRGVRRRQGLPVRGQRTHTNARTPKKLRFLKK
jgi:ribosomal protein S13